ncbi:hypothetical protein [Marinomonas transparens]|nr:hypothetical protein [Marinomonas transparens]
MEKTLVLALGIIAILFITAALSIALMLIKKHNQLKAKPKKHQKP